MTEADKQTWVSLIAHQSRLLGSALPAEQAAAWFSELAPFPLLIVSEALEEVCKHTKQRGWPTFGVLLERCEALALEARQAEDNARKVAALRGSHKPYDFVDKQPPSEVKWAEASTTKLAKALQVCSADPAKREKLQAIKLEKDWGGRLFEYVTGPLDERLALLLAKCLRNAYTALRPWDKDAEAEDRAYLRRTVIAPVKELVFGPQDGRRPKTMAYEAGEG